MTATRGRRHVGVQVSTGTLSLAALEQRSRDRDRFDGVDGGRRTDGGSGGGSGSGGRGASGRGANGRGAPPAPPPPPPPPPPPFPGHLVIHYFDARGKGPPGDVEVRA